MRMAKVHRKFREKFLRRMLDAQRVLCNMVLFHCTTCNNRFPTWHPDKKYHPEFQLQCLRTCSIDVHEWYDAPPRANAQHATVQRGLCARCQKSSICTMFIVSVHITITSLHHAFGLLPT